TPSGAPGLYSRAACQNVPVSAWKWDDHTSRTGTVTGGPPSRTSWVTPESKLRMTNQSAPASTTGGCEMPLPIVSVRSSPFVASSSLICVPPTITTSTPSAGNAGATSTTELSHSGGVVVGAVERGRTVTRLVAGTVVGISASGAVSDGDESTVVTAGWAPSSGAEARPSVHPTHSATI